MIGERISVPFELLASLVDDEPCWFDHHGSCQAHGYFLLANGEQCPQYQLKVALYGDEVA